ncbi:MAG: hypothetical protein ABSC95_28620 [Acetobacteraceae bacterium]|jgi:hypothetical protein
MGIKIVPLVATATPFSTQITKQTVIARRVVSQTLTGRLVPTLSISSDDFTTTSTQPKVHKRFVHFDLASSNVSPDHDLYDPTNRYGYYDDEYTKGYYIDTVTYFIWLQAPGGTPDPTKAHPSWAIQSESPDGPNQSGSVTSSISYNTDASIGAFGPSGVGNIGAGHGFSSSHTHVTTDFLFTQHSSANLLHHKLEMKQMADGTPYVSGSTYTNYYGDLIGLPALALSNLPLPGQAVWMNIDDAGLVDTIDLHVMVKPYYMLAETGMAAPPQVNPESPTDWLRTFSIDFTTLGN